MNFLTKLLQGIAFVPGIVQAVETLFKNKNGSEKRDAAISFVGSALSVTQAITNREIVDAEGFQNGLGKLVDGTVQVLNSSVWAKSKK
jgi:hypothetical protein